MIASVRTLSQEFGETLRCRFEHHCLLIPA